MCNLGEQWCPWPCGWTAYNWKTPYRLQFILGHWGVIGLSYECRYVRTPSEWLSDYRSVTCSVITRDPISGCTDSLSTRHAEISGVGSLCSAHQWSSRQAMHVKRNIEARSCNHCCGWKAVCVIYYECVFVCVRARARILALVIRHANRIFSAPYYVVICGLSGFILFLHIIS
jgi:hypothetical protein